MPRSITRPLIAVIGSLDPARQYQPPLQGDLSQGKAACGELGGALARSGCDLLLFSSKSGYVESLVAAGYIEASTADRPGRIVARPARHQEFVLDLPPRSDVEIQTVRDTSSEWEVSFYRSLLTADAVMLVGGGQSTRVAGVVAITQGIPVLPVATFGGGAGQVWVNLDHDRQDVPEEEIALLGAPWSAESAATLMAYMHRRLQHRQDSRERERQAARRLARTAAHGRAVATVALIAALAGIAVVGDPAPARTGSLGLLLAAPMLAAVAGAIIWDSFASDQHWSRAAVRGFGAGVVTVLLYVAGQLLALPDLLDRLDARRLMFFVVPLGFVAGLTFDLVFHRLRTSPDLASTAMPTTAFPKADEPRW